MLYSSSSCKFILGLVFTHHIFASSRLWFQGNCQDTALPLLPIWRCGENQWRPVGSGQCRWCWMRWVNGKDQSPSVYRCSTNLPDFTFVRETNFRTRDHNLNVKIVLLLKTFVFLQKVSSVRRQKARWYFSLDGSHYQSGTPSSVKCCDPI